MSEGLKQKSNTGEGTNNPVSEHFEHTDTQEDKKKNKFNSKYETHCIENGDTLANTEDYKGDTDIGSNENVL